MLPRALKGLACLSSARTGSRFAMVCLECGAKGQIHAITKSKKSMDVACSPPTGDEEVTVDVTKSTQWSGVPFIRRNRGSVGHYRHKG